MSPVTVRGRETNETKFILLLGAQSDGQDENQDPTKIKGDGILSPNPHPSSSEAKMTPGMSGLAMSTLTDVKLQLKVLLGTVVLSKINIMGNFD